jgi:GNAT superfamily N-acetyltransferase
MDGEWRRGEYVISTDPSRLDVSAIHAFLTAAYWAEGVPIEVVRRSIEGSLAFGLYQGEQQIGFARVVSDYATFAYIGDVFVVEGFRGRGLARWLMEVIVGHPRLQGLRRWLLATRDAHGLYRTVGFTPLAAPERWMERRFSDVYRRKDARPNESEPDQ